MLSSRVPEDTPQFSFCMEYIIFIIDHGYLSFSFNIVNRGWNKSKVIRVEGTRYVIIITFVVAN